MKNLKIAITYFVLMLSIMNGFARANYVPDTDTAYYFTPQNVGFATPQTAEFVKYGNVDINRYNSPLCAARKQYTINKNI